jgi:hypothetical protein
MSSLFKRPLVAAALISGVCFATPAAAQATRTWVSGVGDDVNPCSRTAPCKTFAGAISKTAVGGEIDCLDPGGFGTLTITKSITIDCTGTFGSVLNSGGINGFVINDIASGTPNTAKVILRGLTINGAGTTQGLNGIRFTAGGSLVVEDVFIQNNSSFGVSFQPGGAGAKLKLKHVTIANVSGVSSGGVLVQPTGTGSALVQIEDGTISGTAGTAVRADTTGNSGSGLEIVVKNTQMFGTANGVSVNAPAGTSAVNLLLQDSVVSDVSGIALQGAGSANATIRASNTTITLNGTGISTAGGSNVQSFGNNRLLNNSVNGAFTGSILPSS